MTDTDLQERLQTALIGVYVIERELGSGAMSRVFVAIEQRLGRRVVLKVLPAELAADISTERFLREIKISAGLQHPQIIPVLSAGEAAGLPFYVMPYVEGEGLAERITREGPLPIRDAISILRDVAKALAFAHAKQVMHRDIKPANVLVTGDSAVVADFGIAKAIGAARTEDSSRRSATLTSHGSTIGTPAYMAPEQAAGDPSVDSRADIYSFGCLAYEILTGRPPFSSQSPHKVIAAHLAERPATVRSLRRDCPLELETLVMQCLEKNPEDRPQNASEIVARLDQVHAGRVATRPDRSALQVVAAVLLVGIVAAGWWEFRHNSAEVAPAIAVLPFRSLAGDTAGAYFGQGIAEELALSLQKVPGLKVASPASAAAVLARRLTTSDIGHALHVESLIDGTVRQANGRVRITASLVSTSDGRVVWSEAFDRAASDVFTLQDDLANTILRHLELRLTDAARPSSFRGTDDLTAYDHYLRGRFRISQSYRDVNALPSAVRDFQQAINQDSSFARAYAGYADVLGLLPYFNGTSFDSIIDPMMDAARRAIALDPNLGEAHASLGRAYFYLAKWDTAESEMKTAIQLDPSWAPVHNSYASLLVRRLRLDESIAEASRAAELDPVNAAYEQGLAHTLLIASRPTEAEQHIRRALQLDSTIVRSFTTRLILIDLGHSREVSQTWSAGSPARGEIIYALAKEGRMSEAKQAMVAFEKGPKAFASIDWRATPSELMAKLALGDTSRALELLAAPQGKVPVPYFRSLSDPVLDPLRSSARFAAFISRIGDDPAKLTLPKGGRP